jgi:ribonucleoside-diphosphate reductase alpha chain
MPRVEIKDAKWSLKLGLILASCIEFLYSHVDNFLSNLNQKETKMYSYNDAFNASVEYFEGDELAAKVFLDKYALRDNDGNLLEQIPTEMHHRIAKEFARIEKKKFKNPLTEEVIFGLLDHFKYIIPQGSPMFGIGNNHQIVSLSNCYVVESPEDSYGGICRVDEMLCQISKRRGGVGLDISKIRPAGAGVKNAARNSTGVVSFMERYSNTIREVGQSGRRGALMLTIHVAHPDVEQFVTIKNDATKVTGANISVLLSDEFLTAVEKGEKFRLRFPVDAPPSDTDKWVDAKELWMKMINNAWLRAEPGLLFWDKIKRYNAVDCYHEEGFDTVSTNPCSEITLSKFDSCRLMAMNLYSYVVDPFTNGSYFDYDLFEQHSEIIQRLMDDMIDLEEEKILQIIAKIKKDPEEKGIKTRELELWQNIHDRCTKGRRTGTGVTAMGDTLAALGLKYGSEESIIEVNKIMKTLCLASFRSSMEMAKDIGTFPIWNWEKEKDSEFLAMIKENDPKLYKEISVHGRRNIANLTIAPTGTVSILTQTTSGVEPLFMLFPYTRRKKINPTDKNAKVDFVDQNGDSWQEFTVYHPKVQKWMEITGEKDLTKSPWHGCCAEEINWVDAVRLQAAAQKYIDHAISKTVNLPADVTVEEVAKIYEAAWKYGVKGCTVYRAGCRTSVLLDKSKEEKSKDKIQKNDAPKRPASIDAEVHFSKVKGDDYYVVVGLLEGDPYEVFAGTNSSEGKCIIKKGTNTGKLKKKARGQYVLAAAEETYTLTNIHNHENGDSLCRMLSTALRHGADINFVVHQLEKTEGDLSSLSKVLARSLKKYIKDGSAVSGENCGQCETGKLERQDGCVICKSCGWTKCG